MTVDYDRSQFSVSQALFPEDASSTDIKTVHSPSSGLSTGTIVGIAVGAFVLMCLIIGLFFGHRWWKRRRDLKRWSSKSGTTDRTGSQDLREFYGTKEKQEEERQKMELDAKYTARGSIATRQELESLPPQSPPLPISPLTDSTGKHGSVDSQAAELGGYMVRIFAYDPLLRHFTTCDVDLRPLLIIC